MHPPVLTTAADARAALISVGTLCGELLNEAKRHRGWGLGMVLSIAPKTSKWVAQATATVERVLGPGAARLALLRRLKDPETTAALVNLEARVTELIDAVRAKKVSLEERSVEALAINDRMIATLTGFFIEFQTLTLAFESAVGGPDTVMLSPYREAMPSFDVDLLTTAQQAYSARFSRGDDGNRTGDHHCLWDVVLSLGADRHHSTAAISGLVLAALRNAAPVDDIMILKAIVRAYRRNVDEILRARDALVVLGRDQYSLFEGPPADALSQVQFEAEEVLFALAQVPAILQRASSSAAQLQLRLPAADEWISSEPLLRSQNSHDEFAEFFREYQQLIERRFYAADAKSVLTSAKRCARLGAVALQKSHMKPLVGLSITAR